MPQSARSEYNHIDSIQFNSQWKKTLENMQGVIEIISLQLWKTETSRHTLLLLVSKESILWSIWWSSLKNQKSYLIIIIISQRCFFLCGELRTFPAWFPGLTLNFPILCRLFCHFFSNNLYNFLLLLGIFAIRVATQKIYTFPWLFKENH